MSFFQVQDADGITSTANQIRSKKFDIRGNPPNEAVRKLAPQERRSNASKRLLESYSRYLIDGRDSILSRSSGNKRLVEKRMAGLGHDFQRGMVQAHQDGEFQFHGSDGIDFEYVQEGIVRMYNGGNRTVNGRTRKLTETRLGAALKGLWRKNFNPRLMEHITDGVGLSQYAKYIDTVVRLGTLELCTGPSIAPLMSLFGRVQVSCGQQELASDPVLADIREELHCVGEDAETPFFGLGDPVTVVLPKRCKLKFAYALKREAFCQGIGERLRRIMLGGAMQLDKYWAPEMVQLMFDLWATPTENRWALNMDDIRWRTYYQVQTRVNGLMPTPWENMYNNPTDLSQTNRGLIVAVERVLDDQIDPRTGDPTGCMDLPLSIVGTTREQGRWLRQMLGQVMISRATGGAGNEVVEIDDAPREGWSQQSFFNRWLLKYLQETMAVVYPTWTDDERRQALERQFLVGNTQEAFIVQDEWGTEEQDMPIDWPNFNQEIVWGRKWLQKSGLAVRSPWNAFLVRGVPDTIAGVPVAGQFDPDPSPVGPGTLWP